jgi:hypothetical protein
MADEVVYTEADRTYRVRGLRAKARSIFGASQELDGMIADRLSAGRKALEHWRGPHAVTYANDLNAVLAKLATLKLTLWQAQTTLERFPEAGSWNAGRYGEEIAASARVDVPIEPGTVSAETDELRRYTTVASGQDERFFTLAGTVDLDGVAAEVTREVRSGTDVQTQPVDVRTLITLPRPQDQIRPLVVASAELNTFTCAVAVAIDGADDAALALLARDPSALQAQIAWLRGDPTRRWNALTQAQRNLLIRAAPDQIGSMDGIPTLARDDANRIVLRRTKDDLQIRLDHLLAYGGDPDEIDRLKERLGGIRAIERRLRRRTGPPAYLLGFGTEGNGRAIVAIGNPDTADNAATLVPGIKTPLGPGLDVSIDRADRMVTDAGRQAPGSDTSAIVWLGADLPQSYGAADDPSYAADAAPALRSFQKGLADSHLPGAINHTVIGHSYGSTVVGHAARDGGGLEADNLVFVGSPGVGVDHASDLNIGADHVFATTNGNDAIRPVQASGIVSHGLDPTDHGFGAHVFPSDAGSVWPDAAHSTYWDPGNAARPNMANIITGRYGEVDTVPPPPRWQPPPPP